MSSGLDGMSERRWSVRHYILHAMDIMNYSHHLRTEQT